MKSLVAAIPDATVQFNVPLVLVQEGLPKGAVKVTFAELKQGSPAGTFTGSTEHDGRQVSLPLKDIMARLKPDQFKMRSGQKTIEVPDDIKPVFGQAPKAAPAPAPAPVVAAPSPTPPVPAPAPAPVQMPAAAATPAPAALAPVIAAEPTGIVKAASTVPGVAGAVLAMQDGLTVAKQMPPEVNGDTVAAFVPDIFNRLTTHTKDLKLGDVTMVTVQLGNRQLHVVKNNKFYLSAVSKPGESIATDKFASVAQHLAQLKK